MVSSSGATITRSMDIFADTPTLLWELIRRGRVLRCSVRILRSGLEMQMSFDDREPYFRRTFANQDELDAGVAEEGAQAEADGWASEREHNSFDC